MCDHRSNLIASTWLKASQKKQSSAGGPKRCHPGWNIQEKLLRPPAAANFDESHGARVILKSFVKHFIKSEASAMRLIAPHCLRCILCEMTAQNVM